MLKEFTKKIFTRYGLTEEEIKIYLVYLRVPRATISEVYFAFEGVEEEEENPLDYDRVEEITNKLVEIGFLKEIEGIIKRYIPLEPFFELFTTESETFRDEIANIKDRSLTDQSNRFEKLESIQNNSIQEVQDAVENQVKAFFSDSDVKIENKENRINRGKEKFNDTEKGLESNIHSIMDNLNGDLKNISENFVNENETEINSTKNNLTRLISDLLGDFSSRVDNLETELKRELDDHVDRHKTIAGELKPKMELTLEKYLDRMDKIINDLKERVATLLNQHIDHLKNTTDILQEDLKSTFDERHDIVAKQTTDFKNGVVQLIDNLLEISNRFSDLSEDLASRGSAFKSLFLGKHKKYKARYAQVKEDILTYSKPLKEDFVNESETFISTNLETTGEIKNDVTGIMNTENSQLASETTDLNKKAQDEINAQLENLAGDLAGEIDDTLQSGVDDCSDTTVKLKDSVEKSLTEHQRKYDDSIKQHQDDSLRHYTDFDSKIKRKNETWVSDVNGQFDGAKKNVSEKIDGQISFWEQESTDMNQNLTDLLEDHKTKYQENAKTLENSLSATTRDTTQNTKDAIADFTLEFMNSIDDANELAETNEEKLMDIFEASKEIPEISEVTTWHTVGRDALISSIKDAVYRVKSSIIIVTPVPVPEVLQVISEYAYQKKSARFMLTSNFDMNQYGNIIGKMKQLGNIQFRQLSQEGEYYAVTRDAEEVIIAPHSTKESEMISIVSNQDAYARLYSQFIGPIFQANSRPIK
ncbi:MAG: hypothetical protein GF317_04495 [Candidatus Lokiarchaeota archaeon]|nr:hypothetical protein [Candidatus Lokiarchaeota archaeon]MBD3199149.1 hypothetical protein [Candidatus Lokiarchaeota archaeon]